MEATGFLARRQHARWRGLSIRATDSGSGQTGDVGWARGRGRPPLDRTPHLRLSGPPGGGSEDEQHRWVPGVLGARERPRLPAPARLPPAELVLLSFVCMTTSRRPTAPCPSRVRGWSGVCCGLGAAPRRVSFESVWMIFSGSEQLLEPSENAGEAHVH